MSCISETSTSTNGTVRKKPIKKKEKKTVCISIKDLPTLRIQLIDCSFILKKNSTRITAAYMRRQLAKAEKQVKLNSSQYKSRPSQITNGNSEADNTKNTLKSEKMLDHVVPVACSVGSSAPSSPQSEVDMEAIMELENEIEELDSVDMFPEIDTPPIEIIISPTPTVTTSERASFSSETTEIIGPSIKTSPSPVGGVDSNSRSGSPFIDYRALVHKRMGIRTSKPKVGDPSWMSLRPSNEMYEWLYHRLQNELWSLKPQSSTSSED